eukprot:TRINITY_DN33879_c0_g1_i1.p1 TRINITY_DN33879_c0_g1~~TRINITY_DN33879_c0_g1_i1.p1  ORF type:complete len:280 (+),score=71.67 TRINITY_DN33879_c0_g1_i1:1-840(+)
MKERERHWKMEHMRLQKEKLWEEQVKQVEWSRRHDREFGSVREWKQHRKESEQARDEAEEADTHDEPELRAPRLLPPLPKSENVSVTDGGSDNGSVDMKQVDWLGTHDEPEVVMINTEELEATYAKIERALEVHKGSEVTDSFVAAERLCEKGPALLGVCDVSPLRPLEEEYAGLRPLQPLDFNEATILSVSEESTPMKYNGIPPDEALRERITKSMSAVSPTKPLTVDTLNHRPTTIPCIDNPLKLSEEDVNRLSRRSSPEICFIEACNKSRTFAAMP